MGQLFDRGGAGAGVLPWPLGINPSRSPMGGAARTTQGEWAMGIKAAVKRWLGIGPVTVKVMGGDAPAPATEGAACFDIRAGEDQIVAAGTRRAIGTGLAFEIPPGFAMLVFSRSGHGFKLGVSLANCVGVIDSDYRGELLVCLRNDGDHVLRINKGDRIAQGMVLPVPVVHLVLANSLGETARGINGIGSTGA